MSISIIFISNFVDPSIELCCTSISFHLWLRYKFNTIWPNLVMLSSFLQMSDNVLHVFRKRPLCLRERYCAMLYHISVAYIEFKHTIQNWTFNFCNAEAQVIGHNAIIYITALGLTLEIGVVYFWTYYLSCAKRSYSWIQRYCWSLVLGYRTWFPMALVYKYRTSGVRMDPSDQWDCVFDLNLSTSYEFRIIHKL